MNLHKNVESTLFAVSRAMLSDVLGLQKEIFEIKNRQGRSCAYSFRFNSNASFNFSAFKIGKVQVKTAEIKEIGANSALEDPR